MKRVKYNDNKQPTIYVVATPIGNLSEINQRLIDTLNRVNYIFCEDTRMTSKLLNHLQIKNKKLESYHLHNEFTKIDDVIACVLGNIEIVLVSDAGYPILSDPGQELINEAIKQDINVVVINGSNALIPALINSGFPSIPFTFIGFLPNKSSAALQVLSQFQDYHHTMVLYESIHRLNKTLKHIIDVFGNVPLAISREITKLNEEHIYGLASELLHEQLVLKGELVITIDNSHKGEIAVAIDDVFIEQAVEKLIGEGISKKNAIKQVSKHYGIEKNYVYDLVHKVTKKEQA